MPLYDFKCEFCNIVEERNCSIDKRDVQFHSCGNLMKQIISPTKKDWFRPHWNENFTDQPVFVESKEHMKSLCKKYGVYARCLM